jgi:hypothetical protein
VEIIIRVDPRDVVDVDDLMELNRMGAFPPDAIQLRPALMSEQHLYELQVDGDQARYLMQLMEFGISGEDSLAEWQRRKAGQTELDLDEPPARTFTAIGHRADCVCKHCVVDRSLRQ